ncbi:7517_t:CDS:2, partial [Racocetra fulgida]
GVATGSFDSPYTPWSPIPMTKSDGSSDFVVTLDLKPNTTYYYKFVVDGQWVLDNHLPSHPDSSGNYNHEVEVVSPSPTSAKCDNELEDGNDNNDNIANEKNIEQDTTHVTKEELDQLIVQSKKMPMKNQEINEPRDVTVETITDNVTVTSHNEEIPVNLEEAPESVTGKDEHVLSDNFVGKNTTEEADNLSRDEHVENSSENAKEEQSEETHVSKEVITDYKTNGAIENMTTKLCDATMDTILSKTQSEVESIDASINHIDNQETGNAPKVFVIDATDKVEPLIKEQAKQDEKQEIEQEEIVKVKDTVQNITIEANDTLSSPVEEISHVHKPIQKMDDTEEFGAEEITQDDTEEFGAEEITQDDLEIQPTSEEIVNFEVIQKNNAPVIANQGREIVQGASKDIQVKELASEKIMIKDKSNEIVVNDSFSTIVLDDSIYKEDHDTIDKSQNESHEDSLTTELAKAHEHGTFTSDLIKDHAETSVNLMDSENDEKASEEKIENEYEKNFKETIDETTASHEIPQTKSFQHEEQIETSDAETIKESNAKETTDEAVKAVETTLQDKQELADKHVKITNIETTNEINLKETIGKISKDLEPISVSDILHPELLQHEQVLESVGEVNSTSKHDFNIELFQHEQVSVEDNVEPTVGIPYVESSQHDQKLTEQTKATDTEIIDESAVKETSEEINAVNVSHMESLQYEQDLTRENMESLQHEQDLTRENSESLQHEQELTRENMESLQHEQELTRENIEFLQHEQDLTKENMESLQHEQDLTSENSESLQHEQDLTKENMESLQHEQELTRENIESLQHEQDLTRENMENIESLQYEQDLTRENMESLQHEQDLTKENVESLQHEQDLTKENMESLQHEQDLTRENIENTDTSAIDVPYPGSSHLEQELIKEQVKATDIKKTEESATGLSSAIDVPYTEPDKELVEDQFKTADIEPIGEIPDENVVERESGHPVIDTLPSRAPESSVTANINFPSGVSATIEDQKTEEILKAPQTISNVSKNSRNNKVSSSGESTREITQELVITPKSKLTGKGNEEQTVVSTSQDVVLTRNSKKLLRQTNKCEKVEDGLVYLITTL